MALVHPSFFANYGRTRLETRLEHPLFFFDFFFAFQSITTATRHPTAEHRLIAIAHVLAPRWHTPESALVLLGSAKKKKEKKKPLSL